MKLRLLRTTIVFLVPVLQINFLAAQEQPADSELNEEEKVETARPTANVIVEEYFEGRYLKVFGPLD